MSKAPFSHVYPLQNHAVHCMPLCLSSYLHLRNGISSPANPSHWCASRAQARAPRVRAHDRHPSHDDGSPDNRRFVCSYRTRTGCLLLRPSLNESRCCRRHHHRVGSRWLATQEDSQWRTARRCTARMLYAIRINDCDLLQRQFNYALGRLHLAGK